jgi:hypothetical protein
MSLWSRIVKFIGGTPEEPREIPPEPPREPPREPPESPREPPSSGDRDYWISRVVDRKERIWGDTGRYNPRRAENNTANGISGNKPSIELLKWAATTNEANLHIMIASGNLEYSFLYYK